jgi:hypothetical protein
VFVNKSLAEANNIDVPDPDWNIAEFTRFISHSKPNEFYGLMGQYYTDIKLVETGTRDYTYMLYNRKPGDPYVNMNSDAVRNLLRYFSQWAPYSIQPAYQRGEIAQVFIDENWNWGFKFFIEGKLLALTGDPWNMGDAAHPDQDWWGSVRAADWDIYPRPSTDYMDNVIGVAVGAIVIRNYAMDDGDPALSEEEKARLRVAWEFAAFMLTDTRAMEARAKQEYLTAGSYSVALVDSLPMVPPGPEFSKQMEIWYSVPNHKRLADKNKMPGFQYVMELWEKGQILDIADKVYPRYFEFEGSNRDIFDEWLNAFHVEVAGADRNDPAWLDNIYARLPRWNLLLNERLEDEWRTVNAVLDRYYPKR